MSDFDAIYVDFVPEEVPPTQEQEPIIIRGSSNSEVTM